MSTCMGVNIFSLEDFIFQNEVRGCYWRKLTDPKSVVFMSSICIERYVQDKFALHLVERDRVLCQLQVTSIVYMFVIMLNCLWITFCIAQKASLCITRIFLYPNVGHYIQVSVLLFIIFTKRATVVQHILRIPLRVRYYIQELST